MKRFQIHLVRHLKNQLSNLLLLLVSVLIFLFVKNISDYFFYNYDINAYDLALDLYRFAFLLAIIALREGVKLIIGNTLYVVLKNVLINNFVDRYFGYTDWSWNDFLTIAITLIELLIIKNKILMEKLKKLAKKHWALIGIIAAFIVDHSFDILKNSGLSLTQIDFVKGLGVVFVGYFWNPKNNNQNIEN